MIKAIIFDLDGVIAVSDKLFSDRLGEDYGVSQEHQNEFFEGKFQDLLVGKGDLKEEIRKHVAKWGWKGTVEELLDYWFTGEHLVDERVIDTIRQLRNKGIKTYLATNQEKYRTSYATNEMGLGEIFDGIFSSSGVGYMKKAPEFWQYVLERIPAKPEEIVFWDDSEDNIETARTAGIHAELYTDYNIFAEKLKEYIKL